MFLLFLSNFYPPTSIGGYELWCQEVAVELARRGHQVTVLTSSSNGQIEGFDNQGVQVQRALHLEADLKLFETAIRFFRDRKRYERENLDYVRYAVERNRPEAALVWGMWNVPKAVPSYLEQLLPGRVGYYLCDYWLKLPSAYEQYWRTPSPKALLKVPKYFLGKLALAQMNWEKANHLCLDHTISVSQSVYDNLLDAGIPLQKAQVIYGGIQEDLFIESYNHRIQKIRSAAHLRLLYAGRLSSEKGVHTAIRALAHLPKEAGQRVKLDIVGSGLSDYEAELRALVKDYSLNQQVTFLGWKPHAEIPALLKEYDGLIFPSEWEEPFARSVLEAMATGLVVIGTQTGGTGDALIDGETGLAFPAGDSQQLAAQIQRLLEDSELRFRLVEGGRRRVETLFTFNRMVDQLETTLEQIATPVS